MIISVFQSQLATLKSHRSCILMRRHSWPVKNFVTFPRQPTEEQSIKSVIKFVAEFWRFWRKSQSHRHNVGALTNTLYIIISSKKNALRYDMLLQVSQHSCLSFHTLSYNSTVSMQLFSCQIHGQVSVCSAFCKVLPLGPRDKFVRENVPLLCLLFCPWLCLWSAPSLYIASQTSITRRRQRRGVFWPRWPWEPLLHLLKQCPNWTSFWQTNKRTPLSANALR